MGSRIQKIAFLIFALMFVAIMAVLNTSLLTLGTSANSTLTNTISSDDSSLAAYNDSTVYGSTVQSCAKNPDDVASTILGVMVVTKLDSSGKVYKKAATSSGTSTVYDGATASSKAEYISPTAKFHSSLIPNDNGVPVGIVFVQDGATAPTSVTASNFS